MGTLRVSIILCTFQRPKSLNRCLKSLEEQTHEPFEVLFVKEKGELAALRNQGAARAKGDILTFIDDDTVPTPGWLEGIVRAFEAHPGCVGVSGPATIPATYRNQRDLFRYQQLKQLYDWLFLEGRAGLPGHLAASGAWTTGAAEEGCAYEGQVDFLEACNMSFKAEAFRAVGGFDEAYGGIGDWSEPDLAQRIKKLGGLWFTPQAKLYHLPDKTGAYLNRAVTGARLRNYYRFSERHVRPCFRHSLYKGWLRAYYWLKENRCLGR